jgi:CHASE3 domain sensor protein
LEPRRDQRDRSVGGRRYHLAQCGDPVAKRLGRHTLAVRDQIAQILSLVQSAETGQRGYLLTNSQAYLIPYDRGTAAVEPAIDELGGRVIDNPQQEQSVGRAPRTRQSQA